jgi:hypothetical protein
MCPAWVCEGCTLSSTVPTFLTLRMWVSLFQKNKKYRNEKLDTHNITYNTYFKHIDIRSYHEFTQVQIYKFTNSHKSKHISSQIHTSSSIVHKFRHTSSNISSIALDQDIGLLFIAPPQELRHLSAKSS